MLTKSLATALAATLIAAIPSAAQTTAELLQRGIFAQETEGNLDNAILIYRQIVNSAPADRELAAQAQYRLAQSLLQKGDMNSAAQEFSRLARDYSGYSSVISRLAAPGGTGALRFSAGPAADLQKRAQMAQEVAKKMSELAGVQETQARSQSLMGVEFDNSKSITVPGKVTQVTWINPRSWITVETTGGTYSFVLASPNSMIKIGMTRNSLTVGMDVTVTGLAAKDGSPTGLANTVTSAGRVIFDRMAITNPADQNVR